MVTTELADGGTLTDTPPSPPGQVNNRYVFASKRCARSISILTHENSIDQTVTRAQVNVLIDGIVAFGLPVPTTAGTTSTRAIAIAIAAGHDLAVQVVLPAGDGDEEADTLSLTVTMEFDDGSNGCCLPE